MADAAETPVAEDDETPKKGSKLPLILGVVFGLLGAGGGFMAVQSGVIGGTGDAPEETHEEVKEDLPELSFVEMDTLVVNLPRNAQARHLLFTGQLEVNPDYKSEVQEVLPRIVDVLNGYLRTVEMAVLEDPTSLIQLRAQMLRRVQVVAGEGRVKDLLIMEFVLN